MKLRFPIKVILDAKNSKKIKFLIFLHYFVHFYNNMTTEYLIFLQKVIKIPHNGFERATESQITQINARQVELIFGLFGLLSSKRRHIGSVRGVKN